MSEPSWDNSKCACVHWDSQECASIRDGRHLDDVDERTTRHDWGLKRHCECVCHKDVEPDEDDI